MVSSKGIPDSIAHIEVLLSCQFKYLSALEVQIFLRQQSSAQNF